MILSDLLRSSEKKPGQKQTHTWFAAPCRSGYTTKTLHVTRPSDLHASLLRYVKETIDLTKGSNSVTEKVTEKFRYFVDLDVKAEAIARWARNGSRQGFKDELTALLQELVAICRDVVSQAVGAPVRIIVTTRLPYKLHFHFPDVITDKDRAKKLCAAMQEKLKDSELFANALDESVYSTGLRLIWCHKGSMMTGKKDAVDKSVAEREAHEALFGKGTWSGVYEITDVATWEKLPDKRLSDLQATSIVAGEDALFTQINLGTTRKRAASGTVAKPGRQGKRAGTVAAASRLLSGSEIIRAGPSNDNGVPQALLAAICNAFTFEDGDLSWAARSRQGDTVVLPTRSRKCEFASREHASNHVYLVMNTDGVELRCHDEECRETRLFSRGDMSPEVVAELDAELGFLPVEEITDDMRTTAVTEMIHQLRNIPQGRNLDLRVNPSDIHRTELGDGENYFCDLTNNHYCPICEREHDDTENCVLITMQRLKLLCYKDNFRRSFSVPILERHGNIIFANQVVNNNLSITVNNGADGDIRDFGAYDAFSPLHDSSELNLLCFKSLTGRTCDVARYAVELMKGRYVFHDQAWYWFTQAEGYWRKGIPPDDLLTETISDNYAQLLETYKTEKQMRWLNQLRDDLGHLTKRKAFIEDMERQAQRSPVRVPLGELTHLIGFTNGVYDSRACEFREKQAEDYLTSLIPYDLPAVVDQDIRREMEQVITDIMPDAEVRNFLLTMLALHLEGINRHDIAMVWTGVGGNGKGLLKGLMDKAFGPFHREPPATFLTSERPSADKPNPDLVDVRETRSLFTSEPQAGRKINSGFLKYITGRDPIRIRNVHSGTFIEYIPRFLVTLLCNVIPLIEGGDEDIRGIWRRLKIIHFGTIFTSDPNPNRLHEKLADPMLGEKATNWGPHFMLWLMGIYETYVAGGRRIRVPQEVESNLQDQKDENSPFDAWLEDNLVPAPGKRIHAHRFEKAYNATKPKDHIREGTARNRLILRGVGTPTEKGKERQKDKGCCPNTTSVVLDVDVRDWNEDTRSVRALQ